MKKYYTISETAQEFGVSRQAIFDRIRRGTLRAKKQYVPTTQGFIWLIPAGDIEFARERDRQKAIRREWNRGVKA